jgi:nitrogen fixation NifU-like protein
MLDPAQVRDAFGSPRNVGELPNANGVGEIGDPDRGDWVRVTLRVENERLADIRFQCHGCDAAIGAVSVLTELVKGKHVDEAWEVRDETVLEVLQDFPEVRQHCTSLGAAALHEAIIDWMVRELEGG